MNISYSGIPFLLLLFFLNFPAVIKAQGNHCAVTKSPFKISLDSGKQVYAMQCESCHRADGLGDSTVNPPLTGKNITGDKKFLVGIIIKGSASHKSINGKTYTGEMPANIAITDRQIADVLNYIRNSFGTRAPAIKEKEVKSIRSGLN